MSDLAAFLNARLDEDEAAARDAYYEGQRWITEEEGVYRYPVFSDPVNPAYADQELVQMADRKRDARHIARWDPARVLREVEAKRKIIAEADRSMKSIPFGHRYDFALMTLRALAAVYSDHPDYLEEWRP